MTKATGPLFPARALSETETSRPDHVARNQLLSSHRVFKTACTRSVFKAVQLAEEALQLVLEWTVKHGIKADATTGAFRIAQSRNSAHEIECAAGINRQPKLMDRCHAYLFGDIVACSNTGEVHEFSGSRRDRSASSGMLDVCARQRLP